MGVTDRNFATIAMLAALLMLLGTMALLVSLCGVHADSPLVNTLATGSVGMAGGIAAISVPAKPDQKEPKP